MTISPVPERVPITADPKTLADRQWIDWFRELQQTVGMMGRWIDVPFDSANFSAPVGWSVTAVNTHCYMLVGKTLWLTVSIDPAQATLVSATNYVSVRLPVGFTISRRTVSMAWANNNGTFIGAAAFTVEGYAALNVHPINYPAASFLAGPFGLHVTATVSIV